MAGAGLFLEKKTVGWFAHRGRVCVRVFIGVSVRACCERLRCTV
jgi:hypothetical protein